MPIRFGEFSSESTFVKNLYLMGSYDNKACNLFFYSSSYGIRDYHTQYDWGSNNIVFRIILVRFYEKEIQRCRYRR